MGRHYISREEGREMLGSNLVESLHNINQRLSKVDMEVRNSVYENEDVLVLINTNGTDELAKLATNFAPLEIKYFKDLINLVAESDDLTLSVTKAINAATKGISKLMAEKLIDSFCDCHWLILRDSKLEFGIRMGEELTAYLLQIGIDESCEICKALITTSRFMECKCSSKAHLSCGLRVRVCQKCSSDYK